MLVIAMASISQPRLLLLDELSSAFRPLWCAAGVRITEAHRDLGTSVVIAFEQTVPRLRIA
ncbi:MAG: hypothetical protein H6870_06240 [Methylobacteriaceae bacterium]|nr:hypothetical protein [Methylobacteriaceae bacterium]